MDIIYKRKIANEYEFACYPADMSPPDIFKTLSDFARVIYIKMLLTKEGFAMGLIKTQFRNRPNIPNMTNWKTIYALKGETKTNAVYIYGGGDAVNKEEERKLMQTKTKLDGRYILYVASPFCTVHTLFREFKKCGSIDYIYPAKAKKGKKRYGYAKFENQQAAQIALSSDFLEKYHCKPCRPPLIKRCEEKDPTFEITKKCSGCKMKVNTKTVKYHELICKLQRETKTQSDK